MRPPAACPSCWTALVVIVGSHAVIDRYRLAPIDYDTGGGDCLCGPTTEAVESATNKRCPEGLI